MKAHDTARRCGFTLVELLVVIAIISVLAGLLLPALEETMKAARRIKCLSNQKQLYIAIAGFSSDYGRLPHLFAGNLECMRLPWNGNEVQEVIAEYGNVPVRNESGNLAIDDWDWNGSKGGGDHILRCPATTREPKNYTPMGWGGYHHSRRPWELFDHMFVGFNTQVLATGIDPAFGERRLDLAKRPAEAALLVERAWTTPQNPGQWASVPESSTDNHGGEGLNVASFAGDARWVPFGNTYAHDLRGPATVTREGICTGLGNYGATQSQMMPIEYWIISPLHGYAYYVNNNQNSSRYVLPYGSTNDGPPTIEWFHHEYTGGSNHTEHANRAARFLGYGGFRP